MSKDKEPSNVPKLTIGTILLAGVPVLALCGCVYNLGFYSTAGMAYFTLLELPDFVVAAAKTLPPALAFACLLFMLASRNSYESGILSVRIRLAGKTSEEKLKILDDIDLEDEDSLSFLRENEFLKLVALNAAGDWSEKKNSVLKTLTFFSTIVWFSLISVCIYGFQIPVWALIVSGCAFVCLFSLVSQIHLFRFLWDDPAEGLRMIVTIWATMILSITFVWGVWDARHEESTPRTKYLISYNGIVSLTSDFRRVGDSILFYRQDIDAWAVVDRSGISISSQNHFVESEIEQGE